ncbi:MAG: penicillin acylase family protein [Vicinamibacterales bacterium]
MPRTARLVLLLAGVVTLAGPSRPAAAQTPAAAAGSTSLTLAGLREPVEVIRDRWGIAHIYAKNEHDLFFAQGYLAARDRLFQFEIWRRQATGTMAEIQGRRALKRDIGARLLKYRGNLTQELNHYHPRGELIITAYADGVNAWVGATERDPNLLPIELKMLGVKPGRWTPEIVVSRHNGLYSNIGQELQLGQAVREVGAEKVKQVSYFHPGPGEPVVELDKAIDASLLSNDILEIYNEHRTPPRFAPEDVLPQYRGDRASFERFEEQARLARVQIDGRWRDIGSNNWVVAGRLTQTGKPLLANDPHRAQHAPSLRYWVHLVAPGWNVIGGGEPVLPGVSIGHNEAGAWGLTVFGVDIEDLYVYDTNPASATQYRYMGAWEDMKVVKESVTVKGQTPVAIDLKFTRHGPVLYEDATHHKAYALRAAWLETGAAPYLASLRMNQAKTWEEFRDACAFSRTPAENMIWADVNGNIGWQAVGFPPLRRNWNGLVPVPGDGRYEWDGFLPVKALPFVFNPEKGFWGTANHNLVPPNYPHRDALAWNWSDPFRIARIDEVLGSGRRHSVVDMMLLQNDDTSVPARALVPLLRELSSSDAEVSSAIGRLLAWDRVLDKGSIGAGIYIAWERRLQTNVRDVMVPAKGRPYLEIVPTKKVIDWLVAPGGEFGVDPVAGRNALLLRSLKEAVGDLQKKLGPDPTVWQYGQPKYKHALVVHPLAGAVNAEWRGRFNVGDLPRGGNGETVNNSGDEDNQTSGASFRIVADTDDWDNSVGTNNPGQSGDPSNPHYRDLYELWARGQYFPVAYSRAKIESVAESRQTLVPGATATAPPDVRH